MRPGQNTPSAGPVSFSAVYVGHVVFGPLARLVLMGDDCHDSTPANMNLSLKTFTRVATLSVVLFGGPASLQRLWAQETPLANAPPNTVHTIEIGEHAGYRMIEYRTRGRITSLEIIREHGPNMVIRDSSGDGSFTRSGSTFASDLSIGLWKIGEWH